MQTQRLVLAAAAILTAAVLMVAGAPAHAVIQIQDTHWWAYGNTFSPTGSPIQVSFLARATAADIASGVTFSIEERDPDGNDRLFEVALPWEAPYPAVGTEIRIYASYQLRCTDGSLVAMYVGQWFVTWCDLERGSQTRGAHGGIARSTGESEPESFEFVVVDENGVEAPEQTPEDAYSCSAVAVSSSEVPWMSPAEMVQRGLSIASASPAMPREGLRSQDAGTIYVAFDPGGEQLCGEIPIYNAATLYVVARTAGPTLCGITGVELRVVGIPAGWVASVSLPSGGAGVGDPLGPGGGNVAFTSCQRPSAGIVVLLMIQVYATSTVSDQVIRVLARTPPVNPDFDCPLVTQCDMPLYSISCMDGLEARINPPREAVCDPQSVGVDSRTWSAVKGLYR